ncbi:hypothetical protein Leryth_005189 [Lithospermum erythrorhizon]|nr:hypothetical protein Leryth_005189 [Lithospermum erythrorhizon]
MLLHYMTTICITPTKSNIAKKFTIDWQVSFKTSMTQSNYLNNLKNLTLS